MDIEIPEDLSALDDNSLNDLAERIHSRASEIAESATNDETGELEVSKDQFAELSKLADSADVVTAEQERRQAEAAEINAGAASALARLKGEHADGDDDATAEVADVTDEGELADVDDKTDEDDEPDALEKVDPEKVSVEAATDTPTTPAETSAATPTPSEMARRRPRSAVPRETAVDVHFESTHRSTLGPGRQITSVGDAAQHIHHFLSRLGGGHHTGPREFVPIITGSKGGLDPHLTLDGDEQHNLSTLATLRRQVRQEARARMDDGSDAGLQALVASGAYCAPSEPLYEIFDLGEPQSPLSDATPSVMASRGGVRFLPTPSRVGAGALTVHAPDDNNDPENPDLKACLHIACGVTQEVQVSALAQCVEIGNLQGRTWPEQIEQFLNDVAIAYQERRETFLLDVLDAAATATTTTVNYGFARELINLLTLGAVAYRKRHNMPRSAILNVAVLDIAMDLIKVDLSNSQSLGGSADWMAISDAQVTALFRERNLNPIWLNDDITGGSKFAEDQAAGALNDWPSTLAAWLYPPDSFVRADGGSVDMGVVRDSTLNARNDFQMFEEEWLAAMFLGDEVVKLTVDVCPNGSSAAGEAPYTCTSSS